MRLAVLALRETAAEFASKLPVALITMIENDGTEK
jgi:hypothetical protein